MVPAEHRLVEGIAWDSETNRLFAATVVSRALLVREPLGWVKVEGLDAGSLFGLAIDRRRDLLWLASGRVEQTPSPETAFRGLIAVDLNSLMPARRLPAPDDGSPADIAVGADGTVYASDPVSGAVYRARPGDAALGVLVPPGRLRSPQGLVPAADGRRLYVSDYTRGIAIVSLADGSVTRLEADVATMLDGIDGLTAWRGGLIAIQNGTGPRRILFLTLSRDGRRIRRVRVLESNHEEWGEPTLGFVRGDQFLYVADAQWERYGAGGVPADAEPPRPTAIRFLRP
jgi:sugar lactone lactonase YvrE